MDEELLHEVGKRFSRVITVENGVIKGGLGSAVLEFMADNGYAPQVKRIGVRMSLSNMDRFPNCINCVVWMPKVLQEK